jgi:hypothetical protein
LVFRIPDEAKVYQNFYSGKLLLKFNNYLTIPFLAPIFRRDIAWHSLKTKPTNHKTIVSGFMDAV